MDKSTVLKPAVRSVTDWNSAGRMRLPAGISLRTRRDDINLTEICRQRGGGGHQKAAAFYLSGKTAEHAVEQILSQEV